MQNREATSTDKKCDSKTAQPRTCLQCGKEYNLKFHNSFMTDGTR